MRYILFHGSDYYPDGGACDYGASGADPDELARLGVATDFDWWHVYDTETKSIVAASDQRDIGPVPRAEAS